MDTEARVDGNGIAGALGEVFVYEMTSAWIACGVARWSRSERKHAYMRAPGIVLRCCHCLEVLTTRDDADRARRIGEFYADHRSRS
ncbi:MAG: DUF6510 family protein [Actinomycetota bacterium]